MRSRWKQREPSFQGVDGSRMSQMQPAELAVHPEAASWLGHVECCLAWGCLTRPAPPPLGPPAADHRWTAPSTTG